MLASADSKRRGLNGNENSLLINFIINKRQIASGV